MIFKNTTCSYVVYFRKIPQDPNSADPMRAEQQSIVNLCVSPSEETLVATTNISQLYSFVLSSSDLGKVENIFNNHCTMYNIVYCPILSQICVILTSTCIYRSFIITVLFSIEMADSCRCWCVVFFCAGRKSKLWNFIPNFPQWTSYWFGYLHTETIDCNLFYWSLHPNMELWNLVKY